LKALTDNFHRAASDFVGGVLIGGVWLAASYYLMILVAVLFSGSYALTSALFFLVQPNVGNIPLALGFTFFHKHHVASGILTVAILTNVWMAYRWEQQSLYGVRQSGKSFTSAAKQHFRHVYRGQ
jgi:hypothetical protein